MTRFRTEINAVKRNVEINYGHKILAYGSCFSDHIGNMFKDRQYDCNVNPTGIVFNPIVMAENMRMLLNEDRTEDADIHEAAGKFFSFDYHGSLAAESRTTCLESINLKEDEMHSCLKDADFLFITFGSAWGYRLLESNQLVANCHRVPQADFSKELASVDEIVESFSDTLNQLLEINPSCQVILTVSPVRHWKDGAIENSRSKAHLITACHKLVNNLQNVHYFHAYELLIDDLRDYRFYKDDMLHPSKIAVDYVWSKFCKEFLSNATFEKTLIAERILKLASHNSMSSHPDVATLEKLKDLKKQFQA